MSTPGGDHRKGWIGVDLDGTLAEYHGWNGIDHIGDPVPAMVVRVKAWLAAGQEVRIMTARCSHEDESLNVMARQYIAEWSLKHFGVPLRGTNRKDFQMLQLWDDRAVTVEFNTGKVIG